MDHAALFAGLTPRQREVLNLLLAGHSRPEMAAELHLGIETIKTHCNRLYSRFDVHGQAELQAVFYTALRTSIPAGFATCRCAPAPAHGRTSEPSIRPNGTAGYRDVRARS